MKYNPTTALQFYAPVHTYQPGVGDETHYEKVASRLAGETVNTFWGQWQGAFGNQVVEAQAQGVGETATVRMAYNPTVYQALRTVQVMVVKGADPAAVVDGAPDEANPNLYTLWGGVDNIKEENQYLEFKVRRYQPK